jgi:hypothetical protein
MIMKVFRNLKHDGLDFDLDKSPKFEKSLYKMDGKI